MSDPARHITAALRSGLPAELLVPLAPPGCKRGDRLPERHDGKVPARLEPDGWQPLADWRAPTDPDWLDYCDAHGANVGLRLGMFRAGACFVAVDFDLTNPALAEGARQATARYLADELAAVPVFRATMPARALALFRLPSGVDPGRKVVLNLGDAGKIEILTVGQQAVVGGVHYSGNPIAWSASPAEAPEVFSFETLVDLAGAVVLAIGVEITSRSVGATGDQKTAAELAPPSAAAVVALLNDLPNPLSVDRETYLRVMLSAVGCAQGLDAVGRDPEGIREAAIRWAERWAGHAGEDEAAKWDDDFSTRTAPLAGWENLQRIAGALIPNYRLRQAQDEFDALPVSEPATPEDPRAWRSMLAMVKRGSEKTGFTYTPSAGIANTLIALRHAPDWRGRLRLDEFSGQLQIDGQEITDPDITLISEWMHKQGIKVASALCLEAAAVVGRESGFHPVRQYLDSLVWDGATRADGWLVDYLGAADTTLNRAFGLRFLIAAVARIYQPGCQVDTVLTLEGRQGLRKSTALRTLAGSDWFTDHIPDLASKDAQAQLQGVWIVEHAEMDKLRYAEASRVKSFVSTRVDRFRPSYGKVPVSFPRQCVFAATVNPNGHGYLRDDTGNRRFWPVACGVTWGEEQRVDTHALAAARNQIWAEAVALYHSGAAWWLDDAGLETEQAEATEQRYDADEWASAVADIVAGKSHVTIADVFADSRLFISPKDQDRGSQMRLASVLHTLGWRRKVSWLDGRVQRVYFPPGVIDAKGRKIIAFGATNSG